MGHLKNVLPLPVSLTPQEEHILSAMRVRYFSLYLNRAQEQRKAYQLIRGIDVMNISSDCVPCLLKRVLFQARLADNDSEFNALSAALSTFSEEYEEGRNSAEVATAVHTVAYKAMGISDPYKGLKIIADEVAGNLLDKAQEYVESSDNRLRAAMTVAIIGNIMDFGQTTSIDHPDLFTDLFEELLEQGIDSDDTEIVEECLRKPGDILYVFDNSGESQLDKILIRELKSRGKHVIGVVRGAPILNDVTMEDASRSGLDKELDDIISTEKFAIGIPMKIEKDLSEALSKTSFIIAKGMANFESMEGRDFGVPVAFLLRAKCVPVANALGVDVGTNVARVAV